LKRSIRLLLFLVLQACLLGIAVGARAQEGGTLEIGAPQLDRFPTIQFHLNAYNSAGGFLGRLEQSSIEIVEDGQVLRPEQVEMIETGLQVILALNTSPALASKTSGVPEYERLQQALLQWAGAQKASGLDDYSLATPTGLFLIRSKDPQEFHQALAEYQPDLVSLQPSLNSLAEALDLATDPLDNPLARRAILYVTPPLPGNNDKSLADLATRARGIGVRVNVWLLTPAAPADPAAPDPLQHVAEATGGKFFQVAPANPLPEIEPLFASLRQTYRIQYTSKIDDSGPHNLSVNVRQGASLLASTAQRFDLAVQPPNPIFLDPPAVVQRSWRTPEAKDASPYLDPQEIDLQILIEFPDQHPREITATRLYMNGKLVDENTTAPFDRFTWPVQALTTPSSLLLRAEAVDGLGLSGSSPEIPVEILVDQPARTSLVERISQRGVIAIAAIVVSGMALGLVLAFTSSKRIGRWRRRQSDRRLSKDPLTQPVSIRPTPARKDASRPRKEREQGSPLIPIWPRQASQTGPARLVILDENEQPVTGGSIPLARQEMTFGSDPQRATQVLNSPTVDSLHARLSRTPEGEFILSDQNSIAGTWINYAPVTAGGARLEHGDLIHIGKVMFRFEITDPARIPTAQVRVMDLDPDL
jgi:hypothetical protein